jgi:hypothetical protein
VIKCFPHCVRVPLLKKALGGRSLEVGKYLRERDQKRKKKKKKMEERNNQTLLP